MLMDMPMKESPHDERAKIDHRDTAFLLLLHYGDVNAKRDVDRTSLMWAEGNDKVAYADEFYSTYCRVNGKQS